MMERGTLVRLKSRAAVSAPGSAPRLCPPSLPPALPPALPRAAVSAPSGSHRLLVADGSADDASQGRLHLLRKPGGAGSVGVEDSFYWSLCTIVRFHLCYEVRQKAPADDTLSCLSVDPRLRRLRRRRPRWCGSGLDSSRRSPRRRGGRGCWTRSACRCCLWRASPQPGQASGT